MVWILSNTAGPFHTLEQCFNWLSHQSILLPSLFYRMPLSTRIGVLRKQSAAESAVMHMYSHRCTCMAHCAQWVMWKASAPNKRIDSPTAQAQYACWGQRLPEGRWLIAAQGWWIETGCEMANVNKAREPPVCHQSVRPQSNESSIWMDCTFPPVRSNDPGSPLKSGTPRHDVILNTVSYQ